ncbi:MAG: YraN family protein [Desulfoprunum sp.]|nr:YraN family protein [Desulfoprunum sp.]
MSEKRAVLGKKGEDLAARYLQEKGYTILLRNYRRKLGEIDIIAKEGQTLVFVEVKTRQTGASYFPAEAVTPRKQGQISRTAQEYLIHHNLLNKPARFDVISVSMSSHGIPTIHHIPNAFDLAHDDC